ncbi:MAG: glycosyltransferase family 39 protein [Candidatus Marsarchaeota archaeon]|jgi:4-amino-4-deoxy-L-arabinose transferase-like glycosyltransferase|nr:glycosyltransferase family 39 protein [Candidatus Marsarchaeota archaeon]MCL5418795.1 glycosyltransferase family 39 protein [Candidatus Marsarchaeota archaeon]
MQRDHDAISNGTDRIELIAILIVAIATMIFAYFLVTAFFYGPGVVSAFDSPIYAQLASDIAHHGYYGLDNAGPLATFYLFLTYIALFYKLLGVNTYSGTMANFLLLALSFVGIYKIGSLLNGRKSGILSAIIYVIIPFNIIDTASLGVNILLGLITISTVLFMLMGYKEKRARRSALYYGLSGLFLMLNVIAMIEGVIISLIVLPFLAYLLIKSGRRSLSHIALPFIAGVALGLGLIVLFGILSGGAPLSVFAVDMSWYGNQAIAPHSTPGIGLLALYLQTMFPYYSIIGHSLVCWANFCQALPLPNNTTNLSLLTYTIKNTAIFGYVSGLTFYLALIFGLYMLTKRNRVMLLPVLWVILPLIYLSFGTMSIHSYVGISFVPRFVSIMFPGAALIIGMGITDMLLGNIQQKSKNISIEDRRHLKRYVGISVALLLLLLLFFQCFYISRYVLYTEYSYLYPVIAFGNEINSQYEGTTYVFSNVPIDVIMPYTGYFKNYTYLTSVTNCSQLSASSSSILLCGYNNPAVITRCGFKQINIERPQWLSSYFIFNGVGVIPYQLSSNVSFECYGYVAR